MSTIRTNTLSNLAGSQSIPVDRVAQATAVAWAEWNGTGVPAIVRSYNISSITDIGVGQYGLNLTTPAAAKPTAVASTNGSASGGVCIAGIVSTLTTSVNVQVTNTASGVDNTANYCVIFA